MPAIRLPSCAILDARHPPSVWAYKRPMSDVHRPELVAAKLPVGEAGSPNRVG